MGVTTDTGPRSIPEDSVPRQAATRPRGAVGRPADHDIPHRLAVKGEPMLGTVLGLLVIGLVAGFIARAIVPGRLVLMVCLMIMSRAETDSRVAE